MIEDSIKIQIKLIVLLSILLIAPYKSNINKRVYDPEAKHQVLRKVNRGSVRTRDNIKLIYDKDSKIDFYVSPKDDSIYFKNLDNIIYFENYEEDVENSYHIYIVFNKDNKTFYFLRESIEEVDIKDYSKFIDERVYYYSDNKKKIEPFIPKLQTPKEFYDNFKEYFFPYYLGEYEYTK